MPSHGHATIERPELRAIMLRTGGQMLAQGDLWDIVTKHLGAGVYRISLKRWKP